jgi:hypothetical protein
MAKTNFYKVRTLPGKTIGKAGIFNRLTRGKKRKQLVASVIGVYIIVGGLVGWVLFNNNSNSAKASEAALISASIKLDEDKQYTLGDTIKMSMTLQNTSVSESINSVSINISSTKDVVKWNSISSNNVTSSDTAITPDGSINIPLISSGERVEYEIQGSIQNNDLDYSNIQAKLKYLNKDGVQEGDTNRIVLNTKVSSEQQLLDLKSDKNSYNQSDAIQLNLDAPLGQQYQGKIYISNRSTQEQVSTLDCALSDANTCQSTVKSLPIGDYSALYIDSTDNAYSNIIWFSVTGKQADFVPSTQATLEFPTGTTSINGILPVVAKKVITLNQTPDINSVCSFQIYSGSNLVNTVKVNVDTDRTCKTNLTADVLKNGDGNYIIKLANTKVQSNVTFQSKSANLIALENKTTLLQKGQGVEIAASGIIDANAQPLDGKKVTLGIYHVASATYTELTSIDNQNLMVTAGNFDVTIPSANLDKGGFYLVYIKTEDGQQSDWVALNFEDKQIAFSGTGVLYDSNTLKIGQNINLSLDDLIDRDGNIVTDGDCSADVYATDATTAVSVTGQIKNGLCSATLPAGKITNSGPALISFTADDITNPINQSKQITILPGSAEKYGKISLETEPAKKDFANTLTIGPVSDKYGNLTDAYNYKLDLQDENGALKEQTIQIQDGFAQLSIPSTYFDGSKFIAILKDDKGNELLNRSFDIDSSDSKYISANIPDQISSDKNIQASVDGLNLTNQTDCKLDLFKSQDETSEVSSTYDTTKGSCTFDWDLEQNRSSDRALLQLTAGDRVFNKIVNLQSSDPTNLFVVAPQIRITPDDKLAINLLTSPITDKQGRVVDSSDIKWQYNGKTEQNSINSGLAKLSLTSDKLESKDIQVNNTIRTLELDLNVKAGITSLNKTNSLSIYIGDHDIASTDFNFIPLSTSTEVTQDHDRIFTFNTDTCEGKLINSAGTSSVLQTSYQNGVCYVLAQANPGVNTMSFENAGFTIGTFSYTTVPDSQDVNWCSTSSTSNKCIIQVKAAINSTVQVVIIDADKEYKFTSNDLENSVVVSQNGLNPDTLYQVQVSYKDSQNNPVVQTAQILGSKLIN